MQTPIFWLLLVVHKLHTPQEDRFSQRCKTKRNRLGKWKCDPPFTKGTVSLYYHLVRVVNEAVHRLDDQIFREAFTPKFLKNMRESGLSLDSFLCSKYRAFPVQLKHVEDQEALHYAPRENSERQHLRSFRDISQQHSEG